MGRADEMDDGVVRTQRHGNGISVKGIANDRPFLIYYDGGIYLPFLTAYPETTFGGDFPTEADYTDPFVSELIAERGWMLWPPIRYSYDTVVLDLPGPAPSNRMTSIPQRPIFIWLPRPC